MAFFAVGIVCSTLSLNNGSFLTFLSQYQRVCVCLCKIKCSANTFLLLLSCSHASLSCVFSSYLAFSAFTLDGCAIISRDQWWPCPVFFLALEADGLLYSVIALFHTCPLLAFCMCTSVCLLWLFVHIWPLSLSLREAELEKED